MHKWIPSAAAVLVLAGCQTFQMPGTASSAYTEFDQDQDGVISRQEAQAAPALSNNFSRIDTNGSGGIDADEYASAKAYVSGLSFDEVDINGDGVISVREAEAMPDSLKEAFGTVDADGDDNVSRTEYGVATVNLLEGVDFASVDRDGDKVIGRTEAERVPTLAEIFDRADTDDDGLISQTEFEAARR